MKSFVVCLSLGCLVGVAISEVDDSYDYYVNIDPKLVDDEMKGQLKNLTNPHTVYSYDDVWTAFPTIDIYLPRYPCDVNASHIPDVYSAYCWEPDNSSTTGAQCGNYKKEGDCFNREHLWPKSWFGGFDYGANAQTDFYELWPTDGYVNGLRGNYPFGEIDVSTMTYNSTSGCMIGKCNNADYTGTCFEPNDQMKGDFARSYFYLSTTYWNEWSCCETDGTNGSYMKPWMENIMRQWHAQDPVDDLEMSRNDVIYTQWQHNRNPFIDHPEWVDSISDF